MRSISVVIGHGVLVALVAALVALIPGASSATAAVTATPAIYFVPHQDDEVLSMGADIAAHVAAGRRVILVLVTDGSASGARATLCKVKAVCLTVPEFVAARDREFAASAAALGVRPADVFYEGKPDGKLTAADARAVIASWAARYPGSPLKTMSPHDAHPDHRVLGEALRSLRASGVTKDARFMQSRPYWTSMPVSGWFVAGSPRVGAAANAYRVYDPAAGRYAIGWTHSVPTAFTRLAADPRALVHR